jgi:hypothetical protein
MAHGVSVYGKALKGQLRWLRVGGYDCCLNNKRHDMKKREPNLSAQPTKLVRLDYDEEVKQQALTMIRHGQSAPSVAQTLEISENMLHRWNRVARTKNISNIMKNRSKTRYLPSICLLSGMCLLTACSFSTNFVVVNATDRSIEVQYVIKKPPPPFNQFPPSHALPITPATKEISQLQQQTEWRDLSASEYTFDPISRRVVVSLMPNQALRIEKQDLVDGKTDDASLAAKFSIEEIKITGSYGEIKLQGEQARRMFVAESKQLYSITYK